jgi:hypothetical protein
MKCCSFTGRRPIAPAGIVLLAGALCAQNNPPVNADSAIIQDFQKRVDAYLQLRKSLESNMNRLKSTASTEKINHHENELGLAVRDARKSAKEGDIFTPEISMEIRRLIAIAAQKTNGVHISQSLQHAEPVQLHLNVNDRYPEKAPLQSTPPTLLENLPQLPPEIEYRITGRDLVLLDAKADVVVDVIRGVFS